MSARSPISHGESSLDVEVSLLEKLRYDNRRWHLLTHLGMKYEEQAVRITQLY